MKAFSRIIILLAAFAASVSCLDLGDTILYTDTTMVNVVDGHLVTDTGLIYYIEENNTDRSILDCERAMISCEVLRQRENTDREFMIRLTGFAESTLKDIVPLSTADEESIGNDPVDLMNGWISGGYFNAALQVTSVANSATKHVVNLVYDDVKSNSDTLYFALRHNGFGEVYGSEQSKGKEMKVVSGYFSFPISSLIPEGQSSIVLSFNWKWHHIANYNILPEVEEHNECCVVSTN